MKLRLLLIAVLSWIALADLYARGPSPWVTLQGCQYLIKRANDGDSFHVSVGGKEYIFRLYFVDAPETEREFPQRVEEQAKYFHVSVKDTLQLGELARNYTREKLGKPFIIRTCWEDAMGRSRLPRSYAFVQTDNGDLGEQLVENGLARIHGTAAKPEGLASADAEWQNLKRLQGKAKQEKIGAWGVSEHRMATRAANPESTKGTDPFDAFFHPQKAAVPDTDVAKGPRSPDPQTDIVEKKLNANTASATELENLPGIGPALAQRIVAARPFKSADDLKTVKGLGGKKYDVIRPYFK